MTATEIAEFRLCYNLTQAALATRLGVSLRTIKYWEAGTHPINPSAALLLTTWSRRKALPK